MARKRKLTFGDVIRQTRTERELSLRKFAALAGISASYASAVELGRLVPPAVDTIRAMADVLDTPVDDLLALAGRVPEDIPPIIEQQPLEMAEVIRAADGLSPAQLQQLARHARKLERTG